MPHRTKTIPQILELLATIRQALPEGRAEPLAPDSTWLRAAVDDDRLRWVLEQAGAIMLELGQDAHILYISPNVERITGYPPEEFLGLYVGEHVHPDDLERLVDVSRAMGKGTSPNRPRLRARHKGGGWVHLEAVSAARFRTPDGSIHSVSIVCDVTERQQAWAALRESEERYRVIVEASRDGIVEVDENGVTTFATEVAESLVDFSAQELYEMPPWSPVHPDDRDRVRRSMEDAFRSGRTVELEPFRVRRSDGSYLWWECTGISYTRADGARRFLTVGRDVSERRRQEEERRELDTRMQQAQRLESLGVLAGGIAHDFNNLLTPIIGEARLALSDVPADSPARERLEHIARAAQRAAQLTRQMLTYAGAEAPRAEPLDVSRLVEDMARLVSRAASGKVELRYSLEADLPPVEGDASQIGQVVMNLVTNAVEAVGDGAGDVAIRTGTVDLEVERPPGAPGLAEPLPPGRYVFFEVEDTGCGMDEETRARIFDPFFTTKFTGRGLGLAAVLGIVRSHEGGIELDTRAGRGTRFRVMLPAQEALRSSLARAGKHLARSA